MSVIAVVGSRSIRDYKFVARVLENLKISKIISGGAAGVDSLAKEYALKHNILFEEFLPDYIALGRTAPLERNKKIVEAADFVVAFWDGCSTGTKSVIDYAAEKHKVCLVCAKESGHA